jgi:hypothetical protein
MNVFDNSGTFSQELVIEGMKEMEEKIKEENTKEVVDREKITRMMYEQMLRGIYLQGNPMVNY